jgi:hypothetical protein
MEITVRGLWTLIHGMGFGALYLLACSGAAVELFRLTSSATPTPTPAQERFLKLYLLTMVVLAWFAVLTGAYIVYPWYRAVPPSGTADLAMFPQRLLALQPLHQRLALAGDGVEGARRMARSHLHHDGRGGLPTVRPRPATASRALRTAALTFTAASFLAAGVAGFFGAMINKHAPVDGGHIIQLSQGEAK